MLLHESNDQTVTEFLRDRTPADETSGEVQDANEIAGTLIDFLIEVSLYVAVAALIIVAIRIMWARATGNVAGAKESSNGIGWVFAGLILVLLAPQLVLIVWEAFGGA